MSKVNLVIGDWSGDGHGETATFCIDSNLSPHEILKAYKEGAGVIGVDLEKEVSSEYEDHTISEEQIDLFVAAGYVGGIADLDYFDTDEYVELWLFTVKVGNPDFAYEIIENEDLHIGGYGLFS